MNRTEFVEQYAAFIKQALPLADMARREGLFSLVCDPEKVSGRNIFEYGLSFVIDGTDPCLIEKILGNIIEQEKDEYTRRYKTIQKEAVIGIQQGLNPRMLYHILNSLTDIPPKGDEGYFFAIGGDSNNYDAYFEEANNALLKVLSEGMDIKPKNEADKDQGLVFDDIVWFDDRTVQYLLRHTDSRDLAVALKTASKAVQGKMFKNVSNRAAVMIKEEMDYIGQVGENDAEKAQQKIIDIIMHLKDRGEIIVSRHKD